jgi:hypothetical protein
MPPGHSQPAPWNQRSRFHATAARSKGRPSRHCNMTLREVYSHNTELTNQFEVSFRRPLFWGSWYDTNTVEHPDCRLLFRP